MESLLFQKIMHTTNHPTHFTPTLRSEMDVPQMCSDLFYEQSPCGLILTKGISKKQPHYPMFESSTSQFKPHYSATTLTGALGRRLSNHNVF